MLPGDQFFRPRFGPRRVPRNGDVAANAAALKTDFATLRGWLKASGGLRPFSLYRALALARPRARPTARIYFPGGGLRSSAACEARSAPHWASMRKLGSQRVKKWIADSVRTSSLV